MNQYRNIRKLVATFGHRGELILRHRLGKKTSLKGLEAIYLEEKKDEMLPYFMASSVSRSSDEICIRLEGIDSKEAAARLVQKEVWMDEMAFQQFAGKSAPISLVGYCVIHEGKNLGEILEVIEQPHQILCRLEYQQKEILIPVNEETLRKKDARARTLTVQLPEGLIDLYLNG